MSMMPPPPSSPQQPQTNGGSSGSGNGEGNNDKLSPTPMQAQDSWSLRIATISGIPIRLHFTFLLLVIWFAVMGIGRGSGASQVLFLLGIFLCVALHELGHSIVAQRYGYGVRDIVLYPIGGVAAIEGTPRPRHEFWIALAGPAVNVVIALLLWGYITLVNDVPFVKQLPTVQAGQGGAIRGDAVSLLLFANIMLVVFNMLPAFPMDGGRVLRSVLALKLGRTKATRIAAFVGQAIAVLLGLYGLGLIGNSPNFMLTLIALFVFFGAGQESQMEQTRDVAEGAPVQEAMIREFHTLAPGDSLRQAADALLATTQQDFPVMMGDEVVGVLSRGALLRGLAENGEDAYVAGVMTRDVLFALPGDPLEDIMLRPDGVQRAPVLVRDEMGKLVGMLTIENLMEFLTLRQIMRDREERRAY